MVHLLYKEFRLAIPLLSYLILLLVAGLMFIPQWFYFLVPLYFCFLLVPNLFGLFKSYNDLTFSVMLPVSKREVVKARITSIVLLEVAVMIVIGIFAVIHNVLYSSVNYAFDVNLAYFGMVLIMFTLFNSLFFPLYYRTGYLYGIPTLAATVAAVGFSVAMEVLSMLNAPFRHVMEEVPRNQVLMFVLGVLLFAASSLIVYRISARIFDKVDI